MSNMIERELHFVKPARPDSIGLKRGVRDHPSFCHVCTNFDWEVANTLNVIREGLYLDTVFSAVMVSTTMQDVAVAAAEGCASCSMIVACGTTLAAGHFDVESEREVTITYRTGNALTLAFEESGSYVDQVGSDGAGFIYVELFTLQGRPCPWGTIGCEIAVLNPQDQTWIVPGGHATVLPLSSSASECFDRIKAWMGRCEKDHPYCDPTFVLPTRKQTVVQIPPKRLVYVGKNDDEVKLQDTNGSREKYVALSYCWGDSVGVTLLQSNMEQLYSRMPCSDLLKTHRDAIMITRELGMKYLWTDALCIIQDSLTDKMGEIGNMASIYTGAYLSIAATASSNGASGCFRTRRPTLRMSLNEYDGRQSEVFARVTLSHVAFDWAVADAFSLSARNIFQPHAKTTSRYPIFSRGWTFQERLLSPRMIHYTSDEIVWECLGATSCECGAMDEFVGSRALRERRFAAGVPQDVEIICSKLDRSRRLAQRLNILDHGKDIRPYLTPVLRHDYALMFAMLGYMPEQQEEDQELQDRWQDLVSQYSVRNLTFPSDALPALSGLATAWSSRQPEAQKYMAGLWKDGLYRGVLWKCIDVKLSPRPAAYLAPTWSWASIRRTVDWVAPCNSCVYHTKVLDAVCSTSDTNGFGHALGGRLTVTGPLVEAELKINDQLYHSGRAYARVGNEAPSFIVDSVAEIQSLAPATIYCLWWNTDVTDTTRGGGFARALVLRASKPYQTYPRVFTRIGLMEFMTHYEWQDVFQESEICII